MSVDDSVHILHVDDEPDLADMAATFLERTDERFVVETATSASEGLDRLTDTEFDCIISDYDMPGQNGIEFLEAVREDYPNLPFILYTGKGSEEVASEAISAGVTDYLQKEAGTEQYELLANRIRNYVERARAKNERERHLEAIETTREGISILDESGQFIYVNQAYADLYGYNPEEMIGEHWQLIYPADATQRISEEILPTVYETGYWHGETIGKRADGTTFIKDHVLATTDTDELVCTIRDATDEKERERRFEAIFNNTFTFTGVVKPDGTLIEANETALSFGGYDPEEVINKPLWETGWVESIEESKETVRKGVEQARNGNLFRDEIRIQGAEREAIIDFSIRPVTDEWGDVTLLIPEGRDITEKKQYVRQLETLIDNLPGMVYRCRNERGWPMETVRGEVEVLTGYPASKIESKEGIYGEEIIHPDDRDDVWETVQTAIRDERPFEMTYRIYTKNGDIKYVWERGQTIRSRDGDIEALEGFVTDITERETVRQELSKEREFIDQALDTLDEVFYVLDMDGELERWNCRLSAVTGYSDAEISEMHAVEFFPEEERSQISEAIEDVLNMGYARIKSEFLTADGERIPYEFTGTRLTDTDGEPIGLVGIGREITEQA
ncbi:MAG: PAS domain S-box protein [Halobacteriales archaeon]